MAVKPSSGARANSTPASDPASEELRKTREALEESEKKYRELVQYAPAGISEVDLTTGKFVSVNETFCEKSGYTREELLELSPLDLITSDTPPHDRKTGGERISRFAGSSPPEPTNVYRVRTKDGRTVWIEVISNAVYENGTPVRVRSVVLDVTERKLAEQELLKKEEELTVKSRQLEEVNEALKTLLHQNKDEAKKFEQRILANVEDLVLPYLERLTETDLDVDQRVYLNVARTNLRNIMAPFMRELADRHPELTPRELEVANLVRMGASSKEIARLLDISKRAVEFHRDSLRTKLGLKRSRKNLRAYLASL